MPFVKPSNKILVGGEPLSEELVTEGTSVKPGLLVIKGTGDHQVGLAGDGARNVLGVADYDARYPIADPQRNRAGSAHRRLPKQKNGSLPPNPQRNLCRSNRSPTNTLDRPLRKHPHHQPPRKRPQMRTI